MKPQPLPTTKRQLPPSIGPPMFWGKNTLNTDTAWIPTRILLGNCQVARANITILPRLLIAATWPTLFSIRTRTNSGRNNLWRKSWGIKGRNQGSKTRNQSQDLTPTLSNTTTTATTMPPTKTQRPALSWNTTNTAKLSSKRTDL